MMPGICYPAFRGLITVATGINEKVRFNDSVGQQDTTIAANTYTVKDLLTALLAAMNGASTDTFTGNIETEDGLITITSTASWYPHTVAATPENFWTGGSSTVGQKGVDHFGYEVELANRLGSLQQVSTYPHGKAFYPSEPIQGDDQGNLESTAIEAISMGGDVVAYDFSGTSEYLRTRNINFTWLNQADRDQYEEFWRLYAKQGSPNGRFEYFEDRTVDSSELTVLTGESLQRTSFSQPRFGNPYWDLQTSVRKYKP